MYAPPVDRDETLLVTRKGYENLWSELATLRTDGRSELIERLRQARDDGDLADNPALYEVLEEQAQLEQRIAILEGQLASARIVEPRGDGTAGIGNSVRLRDLRTTEIVEYELVGGIETNVGNGRVSVEAPVGQALVGAEAGQVVAVATPRGTFELEVIEVSAPSVRRTA
jgi:transcription elongation factor GreA